MPVSMKAVLPLRITTHRLVLRRPTPSDAQAIFQTYTEDPVVSRYMIWTPHAALAETEGFIESCIRAWEAGERLASAITLAGADAAIGMIEARLAGRTVDIGYVLAPRLWGRGLMPEAIEALALAALAGPGMYRVQASCDIDNRPSQRALEKAGFLREGRLERCTVHPNLSPEPRPCFMYARCR
jgi:ribosomal-protein-alanine N-acetyltransferase